EFVTAIRAGFRATVGEEEEAVAGLHREFADLGHMGAEPERHRNVNGYRVDGTVTAEEHRTRMAGVDPADAAAGGIDLVELPGHESLGPVKVGDGDIDRGCRL